MTWREGRDLLAMVGILAAAVGLCMGWSPSAQREAATPPVLRAAAAERGPVTWATSEACFYDVSVRLLQWNRVTLGLDPAAACPELAVAREWWVAGGGVEPPPASCLLGTCPP